MYRDQYNIHHQIYYTKTKAASHHQKHADHIGMTAVNIRNETKQPTAQTVDPIFKRRNHWREEGDDEREWLLIHTYISFLIRQWTWTFAKPKNQQRTRENIKTIYKRDRKFLIVFWNFLIFQSSSIYLWYDGIAYTIDIALYE